MRVLHIINSLETGGAEKLLVDTIPHYNQIDNLDVDVLLLNGKQTSFSRVLEDSQCCSVFSLGIGSIYNPINILRLIPFIRKYDLIHCHLFPVQYFVVFAKRLSFSKTKLIFTEHSTSNRRMSNKIFKIIDKFIYKFYERIICISPEVFKIVEEYSKLQEPRLLIINNGVNVSLFKDVRPIPRLNFFNFSEADKIIIQISSFQEPKDQKTLIRALKNLPNHVKLLLVGDGVLKQECVEFTKALNLSKRVMFLGVRTDIPQLLKSSDIVVLSSKYEGLSLSSVEGMASGNPFIASNVPGLKEVVQGAGILFEQGNYKELATIIKRLLEDQKYYNETAAKCLKRANQYDIRIMVDKHIDLYNSLINE